MSSPGEPKRQSPRKSRDGTPVVHGSASLRNAKLGRFCEIKERVQFWDSELGDYSYVERQSEVIYARIGKFCAIASDCRINALEHPAWRVSQHKITYRPNEYFTGAKLDKEFRQRRASRVVEIGHDVWIGHGAIIMPGVAIGHGAVIASGGSGDKGCGAPCDRRRCSRAVSEVALRSENQHADYRARMVGLGTRQAGLRHRRHAGDER